MYEIALCDDDAAFSAQFEETLSGLLNARRIPFCLALFSDIAALRRALENGQKYSLLFLDILFDSEEGIPFAKFLREKNYAMDIVFVTSSPDYAVASYDISALHYLVKPVSCEKLNVALNRFFNKLPQHTLHFTTPLGNLQMRISDISFFEIYGHEIIIHKTDDTRESCIGTLKELESLLPPLTFVRPHRSYLVNLSQIAEITRYQLLLFSGTAIPISKKLYRQVQDSFIDYADKKCLSF